MKTLIIIVFLAIVAIGLILDTDSARAQSTLLEPNNGAAIHLEILRPNAHGVDISNTSFAFFLSGRVQMGGDLFLRAELPFVNYKEESSLDWWRSSENDSQFGNPYLGLDVGNPDNGFQGEFGVRVPVVSNFTETAAAGSSADYIERFESFLPDLLPIYMGVNYRLKTDNGFGMRLRMVPVFWLWVGDRSNSDNDLYLMYSGHAWYENEKVGVGGGISGRFLGTGDADGFDQRSLHQFGFFANYTFGSVMPGFQIRFPLDDGIRRRGVNPTYSLSIGFKL
jgi:hypothetical protein